MFFIIQRGSEWGAVVRETVGLRTTNLVVLIFSIIGGALLVIDGATRDGSPNLLTIGLGVGGILLATLAYQVINLFALHVEKSHE